MSNEPTDTDRDRDKIFREKVKDAYFDLDKADIRPDAREALSATAEILRAYPDIKATIEGHCDERGSTEYNLGLGDRRATAVKQYLVSLGISADRLSTVSYGKEKPFCNEPTNRAISKIVAAISSAPTSARWFANELRQGELRRGGCPTFGFLEGGSYNEEWAERRPRDTVRVGKRISASLARMN